MKGKQVKHWTSKSKDGYFALFHHFLACDLGKGIYPSLSISSDVEGRLEIMLTAFTTLWF